MRIFTTKCILFISIFCYFHEFVKTKRHCGILTRPKPNRNLIGKIVGGYEVGFYKYPWYAGLMINNVVYCGSALIAPGYLLSAAHCYDSYLHSANQQPLEKLYQAKLGTYNNCVYEPTQKTFLVEKVYIHEGYLKDDPYYDICVIKLVGEATGFTPICMPQKILSDNEQQPEAYIAGFGTLAENTDNYPCTMREGRILIYDNATCRKMLKGLTSAPKELMFTNALCAGYMAGGVDTCQGDSGGPLMTFNDDLNIWQIVGVVSFGYGCGDKNSLGIYTDVSRYLDWIQEKAQMRIGDEYEDAPNDQQHDINIAGNSSLTAVSNLIINTIDSIYDHIMNNPRAPSEIIIRFKKKKPQRKSNQQPH